MALEGVQNPNTQDLPEDEQGSIKGLGFRVSEN